MVIIIKDFINILKEAEIYFVNCDFTSSDLQNAGASFLSLVENQFVEILDSQDSRYYLVRTRPRKDENPKIGWIPACFLEKKSTSIGQVFIVLLSQHLNINQFNFLKFFIRLIVELRERLAKMTCYRSKTNSKKPP